MKKTASILFLTIILACAASAGTGGMPMEILAKSGGVVAQSMGGAGSALLSASTAVFLNPAVLESMVNNRIGFSFENFLEGANYNYLSYSGQLGKQGGIGCSLALMNYGSYEVVNDLGAVEGTAEMRDIYGQAVYGRSAFAGIYAGLGVKALVRNMGGKSYSGFNTDIGLYRQAGEYLGFSLILKNFIPLGIKYEVDEDKFPLSVKAGLGISLLSDSLRLAADFESFAAGSGVSVIYTGIEYVVAGIVSLRGGYNTNQEAGGGIGISASGFTLDYGLIKNEVDLAHKISLSYEFGGYGLGMVPEPAVFSPVGGNRRSYIRVNAKIKYDIYKWSAEIKDQAGNVVKSWQGAGVPDDTLVWDGLKENGLPLSDGDYTAVLELTDENDTVLRSRPVTITIGSGEKKDMPLFNE